MIIHSVYFWLRDDLSVAQQEQFRQSLAELVGITSVQTGFIGKPASTDRPVIERSYSIALILHFDSLADHDDYQEHAVHRAFIENCKTFWSRVSITDIEC